MKEESLQSAGDGDGEWVGWGMEKGACQGLKEVGTWAMGIYLSS